MIDKVKKFDCTGCSACSCICPVKAIQMTQDEEGFQYPKIQYDICIHCEACERICPALSGQKQYAKRLERPEAKAAWTKNPKTRLVSTSGGLFTELATTFLQEGGYVAGAIYSETFQVEHFMTDDPADIARLRQSIRSKRQKGYILSSPNTVKGRGECTLCWSAL